jgi:hypothetical protein
MCWIVGLARQRVRDGSLTLHDGLGLGYPGAWNAAAGSLGNVIGCVPCFGVHNGLEGSVGITVGWIRTTVAVVRG